MSAQKNVADHLFARRWDAEMCSDCGLPWDKHTGHVKAKLLEVARLKREHADLLGACEALVAGVEDSVLRFLASHDLSLRSDMEGVLLARMTRARAAIAKAKGRP